MHSNSAQLRRRTSQLWQRLGPQHAKIQLLILEYILGPALLFEVLRTLLDLYKAPRGARLAPVLFTLLAHFALWLVLALVLMICWYLGSEFFSLDLHLYYRLWLRRIKPRNMLSERERDIVKSFDYFRPNDHRWKAKRPCFVRREHLMRRRFWPGWVFAIVTLFTKDKVRQEVFEGGDGQKRWKLAVELTDEHYGIFSNQGKRFLAARFLTGKPDAQEEVLRRSEAAQNFMSPEQESGTHWVWNEDGPMLPVRWASGGFLPLVRYRQDYWVLVFLRDIPPIGLNVPNGASETKDEYKDIKHLMAREFCEEVVIVSGHPVPETEIFQPGFEEVSEFYQFSNVKFAEAHTRLRRDVDGLIINREDEPDSRREVTLLDTPFEIHVSFHDASYNVRRGKSKNVVYSINPAEFGVEVMAFCTFELGEREYVLDGEYDISRQVLIRRPPVLLRLRYLKTIFENMGGSLGPLSQSSTSMGGKLLDKIPPEHCKLFDADVDFRRLRRTKIETELKTGKQGRLRADLEWELKNVIDGWLTKYETAITNARTGGLQGDTQVDKDLRTLCPVTWKTLELGFVHRLFDNLIQQPSEPGKYSE